MAPSWRALRSRLPRRRWVRISLIVALVSVLGAYFFGFERLRYASPLWLIERALTVVPAPDFVKRLLPQTLPKNKPIEVAHRLAQNWSNQQRFWFHHTTQGTSTLPVPYDWFIALEQPGISFIGQSTLLRDGEYLRQFGFIPSPKTLQTAERNLKRYGYETKEDADADLRGAEQDKLAAFKRLPENIDGLPVGFARTPGYKDPVTGHSLPDQLGFTCAACHTGHIEYKGQSLRFDGGPAQTNSKAFRTAIAQSLWYTKNIPGRFRRFADRMLGLNHSEAQRIVLKQEFDRVFEIAYEGKKRDELILKARKEEDVEEGFGRLDALNRIANKVFYRDFLTAGGEKFDEDKSKAVLGFDVRDNLARLSAPVSYPPIWDTPWFMWAQYDASIFQPIIRNAGEALGVEARFNLVAHDKPQNLFKSSIDVADLHNIELLIRGPDPRSGGKPGFKGLVSPRWPGHIFKTDPRWQIDPDQVKEGRKLYAELCAECHLARVNDPVFKAETGAKESFWESEKWVRLSSGGPAYLNLRQMRVDHVGTDPAQSQVMASRKVKLPSYLKVDPANDLARWKCKELPGGSNEMLFSLALMVVTDKAVDRWLDANAVNDAQRKEMLGDRPNCPNSEKHPVYRVRPLDGVWATAPYLHNGSVPTLWDLLSPAEERPKVFYTGLREFDPSRVGFVTKVREPGTTTFDTTIPGNHNTGHEFKGPKVAEPPLGVLGRGLSSDEKRNLIAYLKTL